MILLLLIGIGLAGLSCALLARGMGGSRFGATQPVTQIKRYGFTRTRTEQARAAVGGIVDRAADKLGAQFVGRLTQPNDLRTQLSAAGLYKLTPGKFLGYRVLATIGFPLIWIWMGTTTGFSPIITLLGAIFCGVLGWWAPIQLIKDRAKRRLGEIDYELPELIDLLVVTIEAGLGFVGSLQMAAGRLQGPLGDELRLTLQEQNMGLSINEALHHTMLRVDTPSMRSFVRSVTQGERLGVSIGQIMRDLAGEMRRRRKQSAEERAQKAPIKILFPLVFLIFPAMFIVLLGPALMQFMHALGGIK
jgi:tight adherence protein C